MMDRRTIARKATAEALRTRLRAGYGLDTPICAYDLAGRLGIEVRFFDLPSLEGMYYNSLKPHIILSSLRPSGRRAFTCAHEVGHHSRGDGTCLDEMVEQWTAPRFDPAEFFADCFAGALLMPKTAVERAFALRRWAINECTPDQVYAVSNYFGVGYSTLVHHLSRGLLLLPGSRAERLLKIPPRRAQALAVGWETPNKVWIVDRHWIGRPIDVEAGDLILLHESPRIKGDCAELVADMADGRLLRAKGPGIGRLEASSGWSAFIRVSRRDFVGRDIHRHREEADD